VVDDRSGGVDGDDADAGGVRDRQVVDVVGGRGAAAAGDADAKVELPYRAAGDRDMAVPGAVVYPDVTKRGGGEEAGGMPSPSMTCPLRSRVMLSAPITIPVSGQFTRSLVSFVFAVITSAQGSCLRSAAGGGRQAAREQGHGAQPGRRGFPAAASGDRQAACAGCQAADEPGEGSAPRNSHFFAPFQVSCLEVPAEVSGRAPARAFMPFAIGLNGLIGPRRALIISGIGRC